MTQAGNLSRERKREGMDDEEISPYAETPQIFLSLFFPLVVGKLGTALVEQDAYVGYGILKLHIWLKFYLQL